MHIAKFADYVTRVSIVTTIIVSFVTSFLAPNILCTMIKQDCFNGILYNSVFMEKFCTYRVLVH